jgi:hypothetical protein
MKNLRGDFILENRENQESLIRETKISSNKINGRKYRSVPEQLFNNGSRVISNDSEAFKEKIADLKIVERQFEKPNRLTTTNKMDISVLYTKKLINNTVHMNNFLLTNTDRNSNSNIENQSEAEQPIKTNQIVSSNSENFTMPNILNHEFEKIFASTEKQKTEKEKTVNTKTTINNDIQSENSSPYGLFNKTVQKQLNIFEKVFELNKAKSSLSNLNSSNNSNNNTDKIVAFKDINANKNISKTSSNNNVSIYHHRVNLFEKSNYIMNNTFLKKIFNINYKLPDVFNLTTATKFFLNSSNTNTSAVTIQNFKENLNSQLTSSHNKVFLNNINNTINYIANNSNFVNYFFQTKKPIIQKNSSKLTEKETKISNSLLAIPVNLYKKNATHLIVENVSSSKENIVHISKVNTYSNNNIIKKLELDIHYESLPHNNASDSFEFLKNKPVRLETQQQNTQQQEPFIPTITTKKTFIIGVNDTNSNSSLSNITQEVTDEKQQSQKLSNLFFVQTKQKNYSHEQVSEQLYQQQKQQQEQQEQKQQDQQQQTAIEKTENINIENNNHEMNKISSLVSIEQTKINITQQQQIGEKVSPLTNENKEQQQQLEKNSETNINYSEKNLNLKLNTVESVVKEIFINNNENKQEKVILKNENDKKKIVISKIENNEEEIDAVTDEEKELEEFEKQLFLPIDLHNKNDINNNNNNNNNNEILSKDYLSIDVKNDIPVNNLNKIDNNDNNENRKDQNDINTEIKIIEKNIVDEKKILLLSNKNKSSSSIIEVFDNNAVDEEKKISISIENINTINNQLFLTKNSNINNNNNNNKNNELKSFENETKKEKINKTENLEIKKINYCEGNVDPFKKETVQNFKPPKKANFAAVTEWNDALETMIKNISKLKIGGEILRKTIKDEVKKLEILRFNLFCMYV